MEFKKDVLRFSHKVGLDGILSRIYDDISNNIPKVDEEIKEFKLEGDYRGKVFFPAIEGHMLSHMYRKCILAHAFKTKRYKPFFLLCDGKLDLCHCKELVMDNKAACSLCINRGKEWCKRFGIETNFITDFLPEKSSNESIDKDIISKDMSEYKDVPIDNYVEASTRRYLRRYTIDLSNKKNEKVYNRLFRSGIICVDVAEKIFKNHSFVATIASHPAYIYGGIFMEVSKKNDVPAYSHSGGYRENHIIFGRISNRSPMAQFSDKKIIKKHLSEKISSEENKWVKEHYKNRSEGKTGTDYTKYASNSKKIESDKTKIGLFTNLMWDGSLSAENIVFDSPFKWLETTIDYFSKSNSKKLIIKTHPAEKIRGTKEDVLSWISNRYDLSNEKYSNISVLEPDTDVNPYSLIETLDAGIVYNSTIGLEMAFNEVPVIVVGDTHYRGLGFTYDPNDIKEYKKYIENTEQLKMNKKMTKLAKRYFYFLFNKKHIEFNIHKYDDGEKNIKSKIKKKGITKNSDLNLITSKIISNKPVIKSI
ncbi:Glycosyl/glycerophosphate transferase involved in teichoic acid biosynthesis TagF/TagB/EpsJ/RodC [Methanonatronarchaeum thermophilum]|uniref:Glycosyl/glycerophosphate transferase involved in teichoic acid biosynthesis TagF/TagB/EpsJ/RodC n=1 Tax=Methanonatronarchaeum thermophilum TaxID=1927129 RepID=A0A1Y3G9Z0_9EURY|nr:hypothetical protein [Methanonatronarchaeum thermophilum]OUJ18087.1 Glycosyl/glycerophosphate transferase involved in teichoic acid biosynthesis TagF/TagB/EpsJ/RodC [Methanonatronarchaeum thermophilum]